MRLDDVSRNVEVRVPARAADLPATLRVRGLADLVDIPIFAPPEHSRPEVSGPSDPASFPPRGEATPVKQKDGDLVTIHTP